MEECEPHPVVLTSVAAQPRAEFYTTYISDSDGRQIL
jgi:hypothetical protein